MILLIGCILLTAYLTISFKICELLKINTFHAIVFNYLTCVITGIAVQGGYPDISETVGQEWFPWTFLMGGFFISFFNLIALTVKRNGVAVASVATKLSLVIPFAFSIFLYNEPAGILKIGGIVLAVIAVILTCYPNKNVISPVSTGKAFFLPVVVFIGTGLLDTIIKYTEHNFVSADNHNVYLTTCFVFAFILGGAVLLYNVIVNKATITWKQLLAGILIGIPNYFSIWCLVKVLKEFGDSSSVILPVNNIGILLVGTLVAWLFFKEKLTAVNWIGIALAIISIILITVNL